MQGRGHVFDNPTKLSQMLNFRQQGRGPSELGRCYGVDHTTIIYHCKRHGVETPPGTGGAAAQTVQITPIMVVQKSVRISVASGTARVIIDEFDGSPLNPGKNYAEYLADRQKAREDRLFKRNTGTQ